MRILAHHLFASVAALCVASAAQAGDGRAGGKLVLTDGVTSVEGAAGGGLATWAVIAGNETDRGVGGTGHATRVELPDFRLTSYGAALGLWDRVELSYAHHSFDTRDAGAALGLGRGFTFAQDVLGAKLRVAGDAVWDQDSAMPQIAVGVQYKLADKGPIIHAVGGGETRGTDIYLSATKLILSRGLLLNGTVRLTKANQFGLLGFGGDRNDRYRPEFEGSAALMLSPSVVVGAELRTKPDNLGFAQEDTAIDAFAAWGFHRNLTLTAAYVDLGDIATVKGQRGLFASLQAGF